MKRKHLCGLTLLAGAFIQLWAGGAKETPQTMNIIIDTQTSYQGIEHFGASAAWWAQAIGTWEPATRDAILDLLFDKQKGIGLGIIRYNIGGGKEDSGISDAWRSAATPYNANGSLDWSRDAAAMGIVDGAVARGASVILFTNSPPGPLTISGKPTGRGSQTNLSAADAPDFARFLAACIKELGQRWPLVAISPINEPQWDWNPQKGQEGNYYTPEDAAALVRTLVRVFREEKVSLPLSLLDSAEWSIARNKYFVDALLADPEIRAALGHYAVHSYWSVGEDRQDLADYLARVAPGLPIWQTEWTEMRGEKDAGMQGALSLATTVHEDFCLGQASSWQYWIALSKYQYADGLLYVNEANRTFEATKRLYALGNWSRFVQAGARRIAAQADAGGPLVSAFRNPDGSRVLVVVNGDSAPTPPIRVSEPAGEVPVGRVTLWETSEARNLEERFLKAGDALVFPAQSVTTLVFSAE